MNIDELMKKAKDIEAKMKNAQQELAKLRITGEAGGGLVKITFNGKHEALETFIDESTTSDKILLQDLITAAINDGVHKVDKKAQQQLTDLTGGFNLPDKL